MWSMVAHLRSILAIAALASCRCLTALPARYLLNSWNHTVAGRDCARSATRTRLFSRGDRYEQDLSVGCSAVVGGGRCHDGEFAIAFGQRIQDQRRLEPKRQRQKRQRQDTTTRIARRTTTETTTIKTIRATKAARTIKAATQASQRSPAQSQFQQLFKNQQNQNNQGQKPAIRKQGQFRNQGQNFQGQGGQNRIRRQLQNRNPGSAVPKVPRR